MHYAFANSSPAIIDAFKLVYSKYYEWKPENFKTIVNCDGLSVGDLYDLLIESKQVESIDQGTSQMNIPFSYSSSSTKTDALLRRWDTSLATFSMPNLPENFRIDSSPIVISKYINKVYNSNSTLKAEILFIQNNKLDRDKMFKLNILHQIKDMNRVRLNRTGEKRKNHVTIEEEIGPQSYSGLVLKQRGIATAKARLNFNENFNEKIKIRPKTAKGPRILNPFPDNSGNSI